MRPLSLLPLLFLLAGCGEPYPTAPVSGRVTLDGKPLVHAAVMFSPVAPEGQNNPGPTSSGVTDDDGRYTLTTDITKSKGAVVGKHKVRITYMAPEADPNDDRPKKSKPAGPPIPARYNSKATPLEWTVERGGTGSADFELTSDAKK
jgi:hypothetical protein